MRLLRSFHSLAMTLRGSLSRERDNGESEIMVFFLPRLGKIYFFTRGYGGDGMLIDQLVGLSP